MRQVWTALLLAIVPATFTGCGGRIEFEHQGVHLGQTQSEVEALRPGLEPKSGKRDGEVDVEGGDRAAFERFAPDDEVVYEAYVFEDGRLVLLSLGYGGEAGIDDVAGAIQAVNGKPDQNVSTGGGRAIGWEAGTTELHLLQFPGKNDWKYEDEDGDTQTVRVQFLLWYKDRGSAGGGAMRWIWVAAVAGLGFLALGVILALRKRLEQGHPPASAIPFKVVASLSSLACAGGFGVGLAMEVLTIGDSLAVLLPLVPAFVLNLQLEKQENLQSSLLRPPDDAPSPYG